MPLVVSKAMTVAAVVEENCSTRFAYCLLSIQKAAAWISSTTTILIMLRATILIIVLVIVVIVFIIKDAELLVIVSIQRITVF